MKFGATTVRQNCTKNGLQVSVDHCCAERARFRGAALAASRCPPGGSLRSYDPQPSGLKALVSVSATRRPRARSCPPYDENSQLLSQPAVCHIFAERARFELAIPFWGTHAFQACYPLLESLLNALIISYLNYYLSFLILCLRVICEFFSYQR